MSFTIEDGDIQVYKLARDKDLARDDDAEEYRQKLARQAELQLHRLMLKHGKMMPDIRQARE